MAGTIENAIYADKLDPEGALWTPDEPDPTLDRRALLESSITPSWLICCVKTRLNTLTRTKSTPTEGWQHLKSQFQSGTTLDKAGHSRDAHESF